MRIFLAADGSAGLKVYRLIKKHGHETIGLAVPETEANKALINMAERDGVLRHHAEIVRKPFLAPWLKAQETEIILSIHTSYIMHPDFLAAASVGAFNLHPGPLPAYAGRNPVSWAIFNNEKHHGATLHAMDKGVDSGPVVSQATVPVDPGDTALELMARTSAAGVALVDDFLSRLGNAPIETTPQDMRFRRCYGSNEIPRCRTPAETERFNRARDFGPFPSPWPTTGCQ